jgi:protein TonB
MFRTGVIFVIAAVVIHGIVLLFGGLLFNHDAEAASKRDVELVAEEMDAERKEEEQQREPPPEEMKEQEEQPPDAAQSPTATEQVSAGDEAPALDAASLSALEAALSGGGSGGGDFGGGASLASGGRIGGKGGPSADGEEFSGAFSMSEIDQRPRALMQVAAGYPSEMRARKAEGLVTVIFVVDETGRVVNPRVEKSTHPEFEKPALEAVRQWKFEPAIKGGKRVSCRMRVPFRFQPK